MSTQWRVTFEDGTESIVDQRGSRLHVQDVSDANRQVVKAERIKESWGVRWLVLIDGTVHHRWLGKLSDNSYRWVCITQEATRYDSRQAALAAIEQLKVDAHKVYEFCHTPSEIFVRSAAVLAVSCMKPAKLPEKD